MTKHTSKKPRLKERTDRAWFRRNGPGVEAGGQRHPQSPLRKKYKAKTTFSIYNIHVAH